MYSLLLFDRQEIREGVLRWQGTNNAFLPFQPPVPVVVPEPVLPAGWTLHLSESMQKHYYLNSKTGDRLWRDDEPPAQGDQNYQSIKLGFSAQFCALVEECLHKDRSRRPDVATLLQHPLLQVFVRFLPCNLPPSAYLSCVRRVNWRGASQQSAKCPSSWHISCCRQSSCKEAGRKRTHPSFPVP